MEDEVIVVPVNGAIRPVLMADAEDGESPGPSMPLADPNVATPKRARRKAPGEGTTRRDDDVYDTPEPLAFACCNWLQREVMGFTSNGTPLSPLILEPASGGGSFVKGANATWPTSRIVAVDIREECREPCLTAGAVAFACTDSTTLDPATIARAHLIVTNWPFKLADAMARHFWAHMQPGAVMASILSMTFLGSLDRWEPAGGKKTAGLLTLAPLRFVVPIVPRPDFGATSPKFEAALFCWVKGYEGATTIPLEPLRWVKPPRTRRRK